MEINKKALLNCKKYDLCREGTLSGVSGVYVIPSGRKHESGWAQMNLVATFYDGREPVLCSTFSDDISFYGTGFRMDCDYPSRIIHIWNSHVGKEGFRVRGCSSISMEEKQ